MSFGQFPLGVMPAAFEEENGTTDLDEKPLLGLEDPNSDEELDLERAEQKVWLVKVPRFLMEKWSAVQEEGVILGRVRVYDELDSNGEPKIEVLLPEEPTPSTSDTKGKSRIGARGGQVPTEYKLTLQNANTKNMYLFGEKEEEDEDSGEVGARKRRRVTSLVGTVHHECSLTPSISSLSASSSYSSIMRERQRRAAEPKRTVKMLDVDQGMANRLASGIGMAGVKGRVSSFVKAKPSASQNADLRAARIPQNELIDLLFTHFERSPYWTLKALKEHVRQPETYLKETLLQIAQLLKRGPYVGMWTLLDTFKSGGVKGETDGMKGDEEEEMERRTRNNPLRAEVLVIEDEEDEEMEEVN